MLEAENDFLGVNKNIPPQRLPDGMFQEDVGGDRFQMGSWRRRRGMRHTDKIGLSSPIASMIGFEMPGGDFALVVVNGSTVYGFVNVSQQS
jgi:hypothetical protein